MLQFICYPKCSTCQKARNWLIEQNISFTERDIKAENPSAQEIDTWRKDGSVELKRFFNTSGLQYRALSLKDRLPQMSEDEQLTLLGSDGMLVRRPILIGEDFVLLGFREEEWKRTLIQEG